MRKIFSKKVAAILVGIIFLCLIFAVIKNQVGVRIYQHFFQSDNTEESKEEMTTSLSANETVNDFQDEFYATSHKTQKESGKIEKQTEPLTEEPVILKNIYVTEGVEACLKSYYPNAKEYKWEFYDVISNEWKNIDNTELKMDELNRNVSLCVLPKIGKDSQMVRCTTITESDTYTDIAKIFVLEQKIQNISIKENQREAGKYISASEMAVCVHYQDGREEEIQGLYGLYFLDETVEKEASKTLSGNMVETITTVLTEREYCLVENKEKEILMRYRINENESIEAQTCLKGYDKKAPEIQSVECSGYEVSNTDMPVKVIVVIQAEDNETPYPYLEYAFLPKGEEVQESDWKSNFGFEMEIRQNGTWIAYCRDESGNISMKEQDVIVVDQKAPLMEISLKETGWCTENKIIVNAEDALLVQYSYSCPQKNIDTDWIDSKEFGVNENGLWIVKVRDEAGNISESEIEINNIDKDKPIIQGIREE